MSSLTHPPTHARTHARTHTPASRCSDSNAAELRVWLDAPWAQTSPAQLARAVGLLRRCGRQLASGHAALDAEALTASVGRLLALMPLHALEDATILASPDLPAEALAGVALSRTIALHKSLAAVEAAVAALRGDVKLATAKSEQCEARLARVDELQRQVDRLRRDAGGH
jgi:hypothetical protein